MDIKETIKEFLYLLSKREESDSGRTFYPNHISSCRVLDSQRLGELLKQMEGYVSEEVTLTSDESHSEPV